MDIEEANELIYKGKVQSKERNKLSFLFQKTKRVMDSLNKMK